MKKLGLLLCLGLATLTVSAQENAVSTEAGRKTTFVTNGFWDNWFIGAGAQGNVYINGGTGDADLKNLPSLGGKFFVGKWFSPIWGARLNVQGGTLHPFHDSTIKDADPTMKHMEYLGADVDLMFNMTNYFCKYKSDRFYNFIPFIGVGYAHGFKDDWKAWENNTLTFNAGFLNTFRLSNRLSAFVEISGTLVDDGFDGKTGGDYNWEGIASGSVGLTLNLGKNKFAEATLWDQGLIDDLNNTINKQRAEIAELSKRPKSCPPAPKCPECPTVEKEGSVYVPNVVFFRIGSWAIDKNQEININNTAEYLNANPSSKVKIVGYADKQTGSANRNMVISEKRAKAVAEQLISKYGISRDRVTVEWKGASEQPYKVNEWNRVAIFFAD